MADDLVEHITEELRLVAQEVPLPAPLTMEDCALAIAGAIDGVALLATVTDNDGQGAFRALLALLLSFTALGMMAAGREVDPHEFMSLLEGPPAPTPASG